jgi:three-Cys-motif partner protein
MPPKETIWAAEEHTFAKHRLLRRYLDAWLPIMARHNRRLVLVDGFAGPGRYSGGQPGSPLVMLDAYLGHAYSTKLPYLATVGLTYIFIEQDADRINHLEGELARIARPANVNVYPIQGSFDEEMPKLLDGIPTDKGLVPTFAFIDPFGYTEHDLQLSSRILGFPRCEVLIYMPFPFIARFVDEPAIAAALTKLYGDESWRAAQGKATLPERIRALHDAFVAALHKSAKYVRSFEIVGNGGSTGYHLFFATGHPLGLEKMKEAMWKVDPVGGATFADSTQTGQLVLFEEQPDLSSLAHDLRGHFGGREFAIEQAELFTLEETAFCPSLHLKQVLREIEKADGLSARHPAKARKRNTYPARTFIRFKR